MSPKRGTDGSRSDKSRSYAHVDMKRLLKSVRSAGEKKQDKPLMYFSSGVTLQTAPDRNPNSNICCDTRACQMLT